MTKLLIERFHLPREEAEKLIPADATKFDHVLLDETH